MSQKTSCQLAVSPPVEEEGDGTAYGSLSAALVAAADEAGPRRTPPARDAMTPLLRALTADRASDYRRAFYALAGVLLALYALILVHGPVLQVYYGHDNMGFLSFAWRIRNGIFPNADYHIHLGALNTWIHAAGMWLLGPTASVLPFCNGLVALGIGWLAWTVAARRLPAMLAGLFGFTQAIVAMSPHLMRFDWWASTYDCYYNRQCFAILTVVMLAVFLPLPRSDDRRGEQRDDRIVGAFIGALLFLKINFFMAAAGFFVLACVTARQPRRLVSRHLLGAFAVTVLLCLPMIRFDLLAMFADLRVAAQVKSAYPPSAVTPARMIFWLWDAWFEVILLGAAQGALRAGLIFRRRDQQASAVPAPSWLEFAAVIGMTVLLNITNAQGGTHSETPLLTSWLFVLAGYAVRACGAWKAINPPRRLQPAWSVALMCLLAGALWVYTFGAGLRCLCWSTWPWQSAQVENALALTPVFDSPSLANLRIIGEGGEASLPKTYADKVNDGMQLLRRMGGVHRVGTLDFNNPFPFGLLWPPPRGDFWTWYNGASFDQAVHPAPSEAFGDADVLMIPKFPGEIATVKMMKHLYRDYIVEHFRLVMESDQWLLLQRR